MENKLFLNHPYWVWYLFPTGTWTDTRVKEEWIENIDKSNVTCHTILPGTIPQKKMSQIMCLWSFLNWEYTVKPYQFTLIRRAIQADLEKIYIRNIIFNLFNWVIYYFESQAGFHTLSNLISQCTFLQISVGNFSYRYLRHAFLTLTQSSWPSPLTSKLRLLKIQLVLTPL